jgi:hypothetical protein
LYLPLINPAVLRKIRDLKDLNIKIFKVKDLLAISYLICDVVIIALSNDGVDLGLTQGWMSQVGFAN